MNKGQFTSPEATADERKMEEVALLHERIEYDRVESMTLEGMLKTIGDTIVYYQWATENVERTLQYCKRRMAQLVEENRREDADHNELDRLVKGGCPR